MEHILENIREKLQFFTFQAQMQKNIHINLLSSSQILETKDKAYKYYADYVDRKYEEVEIDEEIINDSKKMRWLHFSDCMNNGGTSQLLQIFHHQKKE